MHPEDGPVVLIARKYCRMERDDIIDRGLGIQLLRDLLPLFVFKTLDRGPSTAGSPCPFAIASTSRSISRLSSPSRNSR